MPHTYLSKVTWVIFVKVDSVVMQATSIVLASWVILVFADVAVASEVSKSSSVWMACLQSR